MLCDQNVWCPQQWGPIHKFLWEARAMSKVWIVLDISRTPLSNNSRRSYATPDTGLSCKEHYPLCRATPGKLLCMTMYIYMHIYRTYYAICAVQFVLESVTIHCAMGDLPGTIHLNKTTPHLPAATVCQSLCC